jgi:hypothetical protein
MAKKKYVTKAEYNAKMKSMIVKHDGFPGFLCHPIGETKKEGKIKYYELEGTNMFFCQDAVLNIVPRGKGKMIHEAIENARDRHRRAQDDLTKGMTATLENEIQEILLIDKLAPATDFNIG